MKTASPRRKPVRVRTTPKITIMMTVVTISPRTAAITVRTVSLAPSPAAMRPGMRRIASSVGFIASR
jgi:hypothetical protein